MGRYRHIVRLPHADCQLRSRQLGKSVLCRTSLGSRIDEQAAEMLRRLLDAGLSRYTPNPVEALNAAERKLLRESTNDLALRHRITRDVQRRYISPPRLHRHRFQKHGWGR